MKLSALGNQVTAERAGNCRLALAMQQDFEYGAISSTYGDVEQVKHVDTGIAGDDSSTTESVVTDCTRNQPVVTAGTVHEIDNENRTTREQLELQAL